MPPWSFQSSRQRQTDNLKNKEVNYIELEDAKGFSDSAVVKNPPANARNTGGAGSILGSGRSPGVGNATRSSILAWKITRDRGNLEVAVHGVATIND